jgi:hypothetical protein
MLEGHFIGILPQLVKGILSYVLVADIDPGVEPGKVNIDPPGVFRRRFEKTGIPDYPGINGVFEAIGIPFLIKGLVLVRRKIYFKIASPFGGINTITGKRQDG